MVEFVDEVLDTPPPVSISARKAQSFDGIGKGELDFQSNNHGFLEGIKIVLFSTKLNVLMVFGPIAIIVDKCHGNHVSLWFVLIVDGVVLL